jgi:very-short-patch-repair endonuclease
VTGQRARRCPLDVPLARGRGERPARRVGLGTALAILSMGAGLGLAPGSAAAEGAEGGSEALAADGAQVRDGTQKAPVPAASRRRARRDQQQQKRKEWWIHAREVLFTGLELDAQQARGVDAIVETQLRHRARFIELDTEFAAAVRRADKERSAALDAELRATNAQIKEHYELFEEMRALLTEEQRPIFDTNRARLVAEGRAARKARRERRSGERPEPDAPLNRRASPSS